MLDVGAGQSDVSVRFGARFDQRGLIEFGRDEIDIARISIEIRASPRPHFEHATFHIAQEIFPPVRHRKLFYHSIS